MYLFIFVLNLAIPRDISCVFYLLIKYVRSTWIDGPGGPVEKSPSPESSEPGKRSSGKSFDGDVHRSNPIFDVPLPKLESNIDRNLKF